MTHHFSMRPYLLKMIKRFFLLLYPVKCKLLTLDYETGKTETVFDLGKGYSSGLTVDDKGIVYYSRRHSQEICALDPDIETILSHSDGLCKYPEVIKYNATTSELLIASGDSMGRNYLYRFKLP